VAIGGAAGIANRTDNSLELDTGGYYATGPFVDWAIFDGGRRKAGVKAAEAEVDAAKASYEDTVRRAFAEVESSLVAVDRSQAQRDALRRLRDTARKAVAVAQGDYRTGLLDQLDVLEAQHQVDQADMLLAQSEVAVTVNVVTLYKALGGGWEVAELPPAGEGPREPSDSDKEKQ
jgi:outer membrane protein TolC